ncbi:catechol 2,3-dioxygenase-like lactoylglutathione lyase family enzyme [Streptosporangium album]|uniref:Catechol 2,3-dioxygenase-like lactoylglutathione lyase family enzyme n=1 Tax=Streptosporangium album TaxID=47479 RepID=A0A7W7S437_9ACTN|nr:DUF4037 domain-containing protein [Streptosporangium album]MBB4943518.1 catechol 2,3-dioxygenase-like lactoylglutathione lyase family enzyme [Streptosporangium album]
MMSSFVPGLELSRAFYARVVQPMVADVAHSAALIGAGSEVLAFDTERSTDHDWGPRVVLFVAPEAAGQLRQVVAAGLPQTFGGYPTVFGAGHGVEVVDAAAWFEERLGFDPLRGATVVDWLATPWQRLAEVTAGEVFHDGLGVLEAARSAVRWYPGDLWRYVLACQWRRLAQREAFPGRCGEVGDDLGSAVLTAGLTRDLMRLVLLMRRRYPPYGKWLGSAFTRLTGTAELGDALAGAVAAGEWRERQRQLGRAYERVAALHNRLGLSEPLQATTRRFHDRPFQVIGAQRFADALGAAIADPRVRALPPVGSVDQFGDCTDLLTCPRRCRAVTRAVLGEWAGEPQNAS